MFIKHSAARIAPLVLLIALSSCTVFLPDNPIIKPTIKNSQKQESYLDIDMLINQAIENIEIVKIKS
jgi:adenylyl- and sulfurtransferase ThiI